MLNENFVALLTFLLAIFALWSNPHDQSIILMVVSAFLGFLGGRRYEYASKNRDKIHKQEK